MAPDSEQGQSIIRRGRNQRSHDGAKGHIYYCVKETIFIAVGSETRGRKVGRMEMVLEAPDLLIYYLDRGTRTSSSADLVQVKYSSSPVVIR